MCASKAAAWMKLLTTPTQSTAVDKRLLDCVTWIRCLVYVFLTLCSLQDDFDATVRTILGNHSLFVSISPWFDQLRETLSQTVEAYTVVHVSTGWQT